MSSTGAAAVLPAARRQVALRWQRPPWRRFGAALVAATLAVLTSGTVSTALNLRLPAPTGPYPVGREHRTFTDSSRAEAGSPSADDHRQIPATLWFPARVGSGEQARYLDDLPLLRGPLVASGELGSLEAIGLRFVRSHARAAAHISGDRDAYPVVILSPGNATNVAFYSALAEDVASHGYVVVGVDHPYQVTAVKLAGAVATYQADSSDSSMADREQHLARRINERVADIRHVLDRLTELTASSTLLDGRLDLDRVGVMGHSNGGIAAMEACRADARLRACLNIDGQGAGGPFGVEPATVAPEQPFAFLTKETALHQELKDRFEVAGEGAYRIVVPAAAHDDFSDGALLAPTLLPLPRTVDRVLTVSRGFTLAFLDVALAGEDASRLGKVIAPLDVYVDVYPLAGKPSLPRGEP